VNVVVRTTPPPVPVIVIGKVPVGVDALVVIPIEVEHVGLHEIGVKVTVEPAG
jgi:hypothetical protein